MRCLHCNKKLSLLKLAKGDSFCSPEHFDAYQLQLSKNAYERLISVPDEEAPKTPLVFKTAEAPPVELEADSALARLSAFRALEKPAVLPPPLAPQFKTPPYAGFLAAPLPSFPPPETVPSLTDTNEPVVAQRDVAFPVHDVEATVCILNLYLRLGLSDTPPRNWARVRNWIAPPEIFPREIALPYLASGPGDSDSEDFTSVRMLTHGGSPAPPMGEPRLSGSEQTEQREPEIETVEPPTAAVSVETDEPRPLGSGLAEQIEAIEQVETVEPPAAAVSVETVEPPAVAVSVETVEPLAAAFSVETVEPLAAAFSVETVEPLAAAFSVETVEPLAAAFSVETVEPLAAALRVDPVEPVAISETAPVHFIEIDFVGPPAPAPVDSIAVLPVKLPAEPVRPAARRLPFLLAPSFQERDSERSPFATEASSAPRDWKRALVLDRVQQRARWSGSIPQSAGFSENSSMAPKDVAGERIQGGFALPAAAGILLPEKRTIDPYQWQPSDSAIDIARPPLPAVRQATRATDYAPTQSSPVRPNATLTPSIDRGQILTASRDCLHREVLGTRPRGEDPPFRTPPAGALAVGLPAILAPLAAWEGFKTRTWKNQVGRFSLPNSIADADPALAPLHCLPKPGSHAFELQRPGPAPAEPIPATRLLAPPEVLNHSAVRPSSLLGSLFQREFTLAASADFGPSDWSAIVSTRMLPVLFDNVDSVPHSKLRLCALTADWQPCLPVRHDVGLFKFLPVRRSPILPPARPWPRLGALPQ